MYFNTFSKINYKIDNRVYELLNLFTRVSIIPNYTSPNLYDKYIIQEGETPDDVASILYGNPLFSWFILLQNNIYSEDEWYSGDNAFLKLLDKKHSGESYYITNLPELQEGDVMVKVLTTSGNTVSTIDETTYRSVSEFNKTFRYVWGRGGSGVFSAGDKIMFGRKNTNTGTVDIIKFTDSGDVTKQTEFTTIKFIQEKVNTPYYFTKEINDVVIPPNVVFSAGTIQSDYISINTIYTNPSDTTLNFANTFLYYYMTHSGNVSPYGIKKYSWYNYEYENYTQKRTLYVVKKQYAVSVMGKIADMIKTNNVGNRILIRL